MTHTYPLFVLATIITVILAATILTLQDNTGAVNQENETSSPEAEVYMTTSKDKYKPGENVTVIIVNNLNETLLTGADYRILVDKNGTWEPCARTAEMAWSDVGYIIPAGGNRTFTIPLPNVGPGHYKVLKEVLLGEDINRPLTLEAEFWITEPDKPFLVLDRKFYDTCDTLHAVILNGLDTPILLYPNYTVERYIYSNWSWIVDANLTGNISTGEPVEIAPGDSYQVDISFCNATDTAKYRIIFTIENPGTGEVTLLKGVFMVESLFYHDYPKG